MSAISTDGMDKWLDDAYPDLDRRKANMIYEIASLIKVFPIFNCDCIVHITTTTCCITWC